MFDFLHNFLEHIRQSPSAFDRDIEMMNRVLIIYFSIVVDVESKHNERTHDIQYISSRNFYIHRVYQNRIRLYLYNNP